MIYKELKLEPGDGYWADSVRLSRLECFLPKNVIDSLKSVHDVMDNTSIWSDGSKVKAATLAEVFPLIIEQGYRYVNTYWLGGSSGQAYKVLTFIR